jgi:two-component system LytT family response regulator
MRKLRCLIVDDEPLALDLIEGYVRKTPALELVGRCSNAFEAMQVLEEENIELVFLDIQMPELSGLELSRTLHKGIKIIFTTAFEKFALEGYKVDALDYLLKPFNYEEFLQAVAKARDWFAMADKQFNLAQDKKDYIFVKADYKHIRINLSEVLYFEGLKDYVKIYLQTSDRPVLSLLSLKALEQQLPEERFMRIHRSFIVNLDQIETVERSRILFGETAIPVADNYKEKFQQYLSSRSIGF